jgi:hypothetical protein
MRSAAADDAAVIEGSWREPEWFAVLFDRHAPHIYRYVVVPALTWLAGLAAGPHASRAQRVAVAQLGTHQQAVAPSAWKLPVMLSLTGTGR